MVPKDAGGIGNQMEKNQTYADRKGSCSKTPYMFFPGPALSWRPACYPTNCYGRTDWSVPDFFGGAVFLKRDLVDLVEDVSRPAMAKRPDGVRLGRNNLAPGDTIAVSGFSAHADGEMVVESSCQYAHEQAEFSTGPRDPMSTDPNHDLDLDLMAGAAFSAAAMRDQKARRRSEAREMLGMLGLEAGPGDEEARLKAPCEDCDGTGEYVGLMTRSDCVSCGGLGRR